MTTPVISGDGIFFPVFLDAANVDRSVACHDAVSGSRDRQPRPHPQWWGVIRERQTSLHHGPLRP